MILYDLFIINYKEELSIHNFSKMLFGGIFTFKYNYIY